MPDEFREWLSVQLKEWGWSMRELGRRANISYTSVANVMSGHRNPTWEFCSAIARALDIPVVDVFHLAGLLPWPDEGQAALQDLVMVANTLPEEKQRELTRYARFLMGGE